MTQLTPIQPNTFDPQVERQLLDLIARFDDAAIRTDREAFSDLWTADAEWEIGEPLPMHVRGRSAIVDALGTLQEQNLFFFRMTGRPLMQIEADRASLRSTTFELAGHAGHHAYANVAFYIDTVIREDGRWLFQKRSYQYIWVDTQAQLTGQAMPLILGGGASLPRAGGDSWSSKS